MTSTSRAKLAVAPEQLLQRGLVFCQRQRYPAHPPAREKQVLSARVQVGRKALRIRRMNGMEARKKRPRWFK